MKVLSKYTTLKTLKTLLLCVFLFYILPVFSLYAFQRNILFHPRTNTTEEIATFAQENDYQIYTYQNADNQPQKALKHDGDPTKPLLIFFNGNAASLDNADYFMSLFKQKNYPYIINIYRGYGDNSGMPSQKAFYGDALSLIESLRLQGYQTDQMIPIGYSIGSASTVYVASHYPQISKMIVLGSFSSIQDIAKSLYPFAPIKSLKLLKDPFPSSRFIQQTSASKLFIHGDHDDVVPLSFGQKLYQHAPEPKHFHLIKNGTHTNLWSLRADQIMLDFIEKPSPH